MFSANLWGRLSTLFLKNISIITTEHTIIKKNETLKHSIINRLLSPLSDKVVAVSNAVAKTVIQEQKISSDKVVVIPNGININSVDTIEKNLYKDNKNNIYSTKPRIAIIGRLVKVKRHDLLLNAISRCIERIPTMICLIIGEGPEREHLKQLTQHLNLSERVFFLGERTDVKELLNYIDLVINTSEQEGLPMSLLEAMAAGIPIIATDIEAHREIIQHGENGILVESGNTKALATYICHLVENPKLANDIGEKGKTTVNNFYNIDKISRIWESLYEEILNKRK
jgi:glycosyltransferase involved in cell wall biosynthesis